VSSLEIKVRCYSGYRGEETPRSILFNDKEIQVNKILDMWLAPDHRYFKFLGSDESLYIIRHDTEGCFWELTVYKDSNSENF